MQPLESLIYHIRPADAFNKQADWNPSKDGSLLISCDSDEKAQGIFKEIIEKVEQANPDNNIEFCGFDLGGKLLQNPSQDQQNKLANTLDQARNLSLVLNNEVKMRLNGYEGEQLIVTVSNGSELFTVQDPSNMHIYMDLLHNFMEVLKAGKTVGIHVIMRVDRKAEKDWRKYFSGTVII